MRESGGVQARYRVRFQAGKAPIFGGKEGWRKGKEWGKEGEKEGAKGKNGGKERGGKNGGKEQGKEGAKKGERKANVLVPSHLGTQLTRQPPQSSSKGSFFVRVRFGGVPSTVEEVVRVRFCCLLS